MTKIKDLSASTNLGGLKIKTTDGTIGYWKSQWNKGVWLQRESDIENGRVIPIFVDNLKETLEWEVLDNVNLEG